MVAHVCKPDKGIAWVVMVASFGAHVVTGCFLYNVGIIHNSLLERFQEDVGVTSLAGTFYLSLVSLTGVVSSVVTNRFSCRITMIIGGILMSLGLAASAVLPTLNWVIVSYGIVAGLCYSAHVVVIGYNFHRKRNFATGIAVSGSGFGTFALAPILEVSRDSYGNSGFFFIMAGIALHMVFFGTLFFPSELELKRKNEHQERKSGKQDIGQKHCYSRFVSALKYFKILKKLQFTFLCFSMCFAYFGIYLVYVHFSTYMLVMKLNALQASYLLSVNGVCNCVSRILAGMATSADNIDDLIVYFGTFGFLGISTVLFPLYSSSLPGQATYSCFLGLSQGCCYAVLNSLVVRFAGLSNLATGFGLIMFFSGIGALGGPPFAGYIVDNGGSYEQAFLIAGLSILTASLLGMITVCFERKTSSSVDFEHNTDQPVSVISFNNTAFKVEMRPTKIKISEIHK